MHIPRTLRPRAPLGPLGLCGTRPRNPGAGRCAPAVPPPPVLSSGVRNRNGAPVRGWDSRPRRFACLGQPTYLSPSRAVAFLFLVTNAAFRKAFHKLSNDGSQHDEAPRGRHRPRARFLRVREESVRGHAASCAPAHCCVGGPRRRQAPRRTQHHLVLQALRPRLSGKADPPGRQCGGSDPGPAEPAA